MSPAAGQGVAYSVLMKWWWLSVAVLVVAFALALAGIISGDGILGVPRTLCGFLAAMTALGGLVLAIWRGIIEGEQIRAPRNLPEHRH
ncbi:MAG: hypothetical protein R2719_12425 [Micropruina sp.]|nr:hypothetical protein [Micropruina sp.]